MRPTAQINKLALGVIRYSFICGDGFDQLNLKRLILLPIIGDRFISGPYGPLNRLVPVHNFMHPCFNRREIICGEGLFTMEIIIKAVFDRRTNGDLRIWIQL